MASVRICVLAMPNSRTNEVVGWEEDPRAGRVLRVRVAVPPVDGKANAAIRELLADWLGVAKSRVRLEKGAGARIKVFEVAGGVEPGGVGNFRR